MANRESSVERTREPRRWVKGQFSTAQASSCGAGFSHHENFRTAKRVAEIFNPTKDAEGEVKRCKLISSLKRPLWGNCKQIANYCKQKFAFRAGICQYLRRRKTHRSLKIAQSGLRSL